MFGRDSEGNAGLLGVNGSNAVVPSFMRDKVWQPNTTEDLGVIPRALRDVFARIRKSKSQQSAVSLQPDAQPKDGAGTKPPKRSIKYRVYCSMMQIYNENIYDLLRDPLRTTPLSIHEDGHYGIYVEGLAEYRVKTMHECLALLVRGDDSRAVRTTHMNAMSSRSHTIFQLLLEQVVTEKESISAPSAKSTSVSATPNPSAPKTVRAKLNLVDLAGSEKWDIGREIADGHASELTNINLSLHTLGRCIRALAKHAKGSRREEGSRGKERGQNGMSHIPFRNSKLTRLLQDSLGGTAKTRVVATLSPSSLNFLETISTLKFADRAAQVMQFVRVHEVQKVDMALVSKLRQEIDALRKRNALLNERLTLVSQGGSGAGAMGETGPPEGRNQDSSTCCSPSSSSSSSALKLPSLHDGPASFPPQSASALQGSVSRQRQQRQRPEGADGSKTLAIPVIQECTHILETIRKLGHRFFDFEVEEDEFKKELNSILRMSISTLKERAKTASQTTYSARRDGGGEANKDGREQLGGTGPRGEAFERRGEEAKRENEGRGGRREAGGMRPLKPAHYNARKPPKPTPKSSRGRHDKESVGFMPSSSRIREQGPSRKKGKGRTSPQVRAGGRSGDMTGGGNGLSMSLRTPNAQGNGRGFGMSEGSASRADGGKLSSKLRVRRARYGGGGGGKGGEKWNNGWIDEWTPIKLPV